MKLLVLLALSLAVMMVNVAGEPECESPYKIDLNDLSILTPSFLKVQPSLQSFAQLEIIKSYELLLLSIYHGTYKSNRPGFEKMFRDLADKSWDDGIDIIKHITKRGGEMNFNSSIALQHQIKYSSSRRYTNTEMQALALSLDIEREINAKAFHIHESISHYKHRPHYDPEIAQYIEEKFIEKQADIIRKLSGHVHIFGGLVKNSQNNVIPDSSLNIYLFDHYLQKDSIL